ALEVTGMDIPAVLDDSAANADALQLFCQAAQRARPGFRLDAETLPHVARICRLVLGAPLGIELAAGWLRLLTPAQVADAIQNDLSLLSSSSPDLPERHRSFRALLDHTWALLTPREQDVFYRLAVFEGGFTVGAAQQVTAAGLGELAGLVEKSLIGRDAAGRYAIHGLLRQYALQRPAPDSLRGADPHRDYAAYYLALAARSEPDLRGPRQPQALADLMAEQDNLRAAWQWAAAHSQWEILAASLEAMVAFYDARGHFHEASLLLAPLDDLPPGDFAGWAYAARGFFADRLAQYGQAQSFNQRSLEQFEQTGNLSGQARALANLGMNAIYRGKLDDAAQSLQRALDLSRQCGDEPGRGRCLSLLGVVYKQKGDYEPARRAQEEALLIFRTLDDPQRVAATANNLGSVLRAQGRLAAAQACYEENLSIRRMLGDPRGTALALVNLANLLAQMGQVESARAHYTESLSISEDLGDLWGRALCLHNLGDLARQQADYARAARHYTDSLVLRRRVDDQTGMAYSLAGLGHACAAQGDDARAMEYFQEAAQAALARRLLPLALDILAGAAGLHARAGSLPRAQWLAAFLLSQPALEPHLAQAMRQIAPHPAALPPSLDLAAVVSEAFDLESPPRFG
ncbi:MAG: tetratricopeptide repeat protein, partial [Anaerolineales bacterium]